MENRNDRCYIAWRTQVENSLTPCIPIRICGSQGGYHGTDTLYIDITDKLKEGKNIETISTIVIEYKKSLSS